MERETIIRQVVKGKIQNRVTIPKHWSTDYVAIKPVKIPNIQNVRDKYAKK